MDILSPRRRGMKEEVMERPDNDGILEQFYPISAFANSQAED